MLALYFLSKQTRFRKHCSSFSPLVSCPNMVMRLLYASPEVEGIMQQCILITCCCSRYSNCFRLLWVCILVQVQQGRTDTESATLFCLPTVGADPPPGLTPYMELTPCMEPTPYTDSTSYTELTLARS